MCKHDEYYSQRTKIPVLYDVRYGDFTFKYAYDRNPDLNYYSIEHYHTSWELMYLLQGEAELTIQHKQYRIFPQRLFIIKPGEFHHLSLLPCDVYERIILRFSDNDLPQSLMEKMKDVSNSYYIAGTRLADEIRRLETLNDTFGRDDILDVFILQLQIILTLLARTGKSDDDYDVNEDLKKVLKYIDMNLVSIQAVDDVVNKVSMSSSKIQKLMSDQLHTSLMEYVRTKKCMLATSLMKEGAPATTLYRDCGFLDYSTFYRAFKATFNVTPRNMEKQLQKKFGVQQKKGHLLTDE